MFGHELRRIAEALERIACALDTLAHPERAELRRAVAAMQHERERLAGVMAGATDSTAAAAGAIPPVAASPTSPNGA